MADNVMLIGESFIGDGADAAHVDTVLGRRDGPVRVVWATALGTPWPGNAAFVAVVRPRVPAKPLTLFVSKASVAGDEHAALAWGAAQAGVACGVADAVAGEPSIAAMLTARDHPVNPYLGPAVAAPARP
jgi:5,6,7,8-tetrahydromethanopterin hydro-lyase